MPQRCLEQGFVRAVICRNAAPGQATASSCTQHLPPGQAAASSCTQHLRPRPGDSLIRRRYGGGVSNRCRWADRFAMSEQQQSCGYMQSMERHFQRSRELFRTDRGRPCPREWKDPQAKRCGRMERSGSLCGRGYRSAGCRRAEAAAREMLRGSRCGSIGKQLPAEVPMQRAIGKQLQAGKHFPAGKAQGIIGKRLRAGKPQGIKGKMLRAGKAQGIIGKRLQAGKAQGSIGKRLQAGKKQRCLWVVSNGQVPGS